MKKFLQLRWPAYAVILGVFLAVAFAHPSNAGMILKQKTDGSAVWEKNDSVAGSHGADNTYVIGRQVLTVHFDDLSTAETQFIVTPESRKVSAVYVLINDALSVTGSHTAETFSFATANSPEHGSGTYSNRFTTVDVTASGSYAGELNTSTGLSHPLDAQEPLAIGNAGKGASNEDAVVYIILDPV